ncbi:translation initiation factor IF-2-like isoform X1 [Canis lupus familiaris]|uniref:translation initiation factor IF-2-like isoform X1 n=1 Tax=Canis lupus familiaris TaxID=9615 RepID=UPI0018F2AAE1|nr:translation initiation factor IF-2-like isoform X1 [Canis lupus familiaris]XP_038404801.1 translation initiation factor IF-2-like isoform X1 [Canis lupus familiaris]
MCPERSGTAVGAGAGRRRALTGTLGRLRRGSACASPSHREVAAPTVCGQGRDRTDPVPGTSSAEGGPRQTREVGGGSAPRRQAGALTPWMEGSPLWGHPAPPAAQACPCLGGLGGGWGGPGVGLDHPQGLRGLRGRVGQAPELLSALLPPGHLAGPVLGGPLSALRHVCVRPGSRRSGRRTVERARQAAMPPGGLPGTVSAERHTGDGQGAGQRTPAPASGGRAGAPPRQCRPVEAQDGYSQGRVSRSRARRRPGKSSWPDAALVTALLVLNLTLLLEAELTRPSLRAPAFQRQASTCSLGWRSSIQEHVFLLLPYVWMLQREDCTPCQQCHPRGVSWQGSPTPLAT